MQIQLLREYLTVPSPAAQYLLIIFFQTKSPVSER